MEMNIFFIIQKNSKEWIRGVSGVKYEIWTDMFNMSIVENQCYCFSGRSLNDCDGYSDCSGTYAGVAFALTLPHFIGSPGLAKKIYGLRPNPDKHLSIMWLEQYLGIPIDVQLALQFNWPLHHLPSIGSLSNIRRCILPLGWFKGVSVCVCFYNLNFYCFFCM